MSSKRRPPLLGFHSGSHFSQPRWSTTTRTTKAHPSGNREPRAHHAGRDEGRSPRVAPPSSRRPAPRISDALSGSTGLESEWVCGLVYTPPPEHLPAALSADRLLLQTSSVAAIAAPTEQRLSRLFSRRGLAPHKSPGQRPNEARSAPVAIDPRVISGRRRGGDVRAPRVPVYKLSIPTNDLYKLVFGAYPRLLVGRCQWGPPGALSGDIDAQHGSPLAPSQRVSATLKN